MITYLQFIAIPLTPSKAGILTLSQVLSECTFYNYKSQKVRFFSHNAVKPHIAYTNLRKIRFYNYKFLISIENLLLLTDDIT